MRMMGSAETKLQSWVFFRSGRHRQIKLLEGRMVSNCKQVTNLPIGPSQKTFTSRYEQSHTCESNHLPVDFDFLAVPMKLGLLKIISIFKILDHHRFRRYSIRTTPKKMRELIWYQRIPWSRLEKRHWDSPYSGSAKFFSRYNMTRNWWPTFRQTYSGKWVYKSGGYMRIYSHLNLSRCGKRHGWTSNLVDASEWEVIYILKKWGKSSIPRSYLVNSLSIIDGFTTGL